MPSTSIVIPVYNSEKSLSSLVKQIEIHKPRISQKIEVILINDGSRDNSWEVICELIDLYPWVKGINLMRNYGQHNALLCGIREAQYEVIITMDDDLQHPPHEIPTLLEKLNQGYDIVYGVPIKTKHGFWRGICSILLKKTLATVMSSEIAQNTSPFRAIRTDVRNAFQHYNSCFISIDALLTWGTNSFTSVKVQHDTRKFGRSNYSIGKLFNHAFDIITSFSTLPLRLASYIGFSFFAFGILLLIYVVGRYIIEGGSIPGFPFLASTISIFAGVQLFILGIVGEYLARMHIRIMSKPAYVIKNISFPNQKKEKDNE